MKTELMIFQILSWNSKLYLLIKLKALTQLSWYNDIQDEESLKIINDIIALSKDWHSALIRHYIAMNSLRKKNMALDDLLWVRLKY